MDDQLDKVTIKEGNRERTIFIPGAKDMDRNQYQDILEWQTEKTKRELRQPKPERKHSKKEVSKALRDYNEHRRRKAEGTKKYF
jgi:hypothetical protein